MATRFGGLRKLQAVEPDAKGAGPLPDPAPDSHARCAFSARRAARQSERLVRS